MAGPAPATTVEPAVPDPSPAALDRAPASGRAVPAWLTRAHAAGWLLLIPALAALVVLFVVPLVTVIVDSVTEPAPGLGNYAALFTDGYTLLVLGRTLLVSAAVAVVGVLFAYPYAYAMTLAGPTMRAVLVTVVLVPFWTSMLARNFAWLVLMQDGGVITSALAWLGFGEVTLLGTTLAVGISMTQVMLPFLVLPLYSAMQQIDGRLVVAGQSLGAPRARAFRRIYLPLSAPGVVAGMSLVFVLALGFYVTPALLGSARTAMIAQVINIRAKELLDFGGAGAMGIFLLVVALVVLGLSRRLAGAGAAAVPVGAAAGGARPTGAQGSRMRPWLRVHTAITAILLVAPTLVVLPMSFSAAQTFRFPPDEWSLRWYAKLFSSPEWVAALINSLQAGIFTALFATVLGTAAAFGLTRLGRRWRGPINGFLLSPMIVPHILVALVVFAAFLRIGLNGTLFGIILAHTALALPFVVIAVSARLQGMDARLPLVAVSLGADPVSAFRRVTLPLVLPGVLSGAVLAFVSSLDEVVIALFLQAPGAITLPVQMFNSVTVQIDPTISAASSLMVVLVSVPILVAQIVGARRGRKGTR
ncbi:putative spermidine/putrescine transport system permease protein [Pseudonocardia thermophila]|uniref:Putative spermidine/putrescine transport system permease protein n=1 Tax=Pseudonocardia thermophila TaxID=1848 RepID=A0A1M6PKG0_PSETH|nr:ABC transporter permease subunit [Pseudonocardia thermophila]SHK08394.1 putative spermidine/putrescine transport system permease protein [Pseudonocardia thermophila]